MILNLCEQYIDGQIEAQDDLPGYLIRSLQTRPWPVDYWYVLESLNRYYRPDCIVVPRTRRHQVADVSLHLPGVEVKVL